jgi:hypothetical protein
VSGILGPIFDYFTQSISQARHAIFHVFNFSNS